MISESSILIGFEPTSDYFYLSNKDSILKDLTSKQMKNKTKN